MTIPSDLAAALKSNTKAHQAFRALPPSHQQEYVKWIKEATKSETRQRRAAKAAEMILKRRGE